MTRGVVLALDTSFGPVSAALLSAEGQVLGQAHVADAAGQQAEILPPLVARLIATSGVPMESLSRIVVATGPGAFTGVRVGLAFAKGLRIALAVDVVGVPSLSCLGVQAQALHPGHAVGVIMDARRSEAYVLVLDALGQALLGPALLGLDEASRIVSRVSPAGLLLFGTGRTLVQVPGAVCPAADVTAVDAVALGRHGLGLDAVLHPPVPTYLRPPDARLPA